VLRNDGIAKAREHIGNRICHISCSLYSLLALSLQLSAAFSEWLRADS
jgi:hypothetical protein